MTDLFHVAQSTADRWRADGRFVLFGEGVIRTPDLDDKATWYDEPPAAMIEAAKPCEKHQPVNRGPNWSSTLPRYACSCDDNGQRRHPVTVPCYCVPIREAGRTWPYGDCLVPEPCTNGRITVAHAVVECGPLRVYDTGPMTDEEMDALDEAGDWIERDGNHLIWWHEDRKIDGTYCTRLALPPDVDPASLVGQWAIGGRIEVAG